MQPGNGGLAALWLSVLAGLFTASPAAAQRLADVVESERCSGERIARVVSAASQRDVVGDLAGVGRYVNASLRRLQPTTRHSTVTRYLLLRAGDVCDEARRAESERILRAQNFISDAVVRVRRLPSGEVELHVEVIDEFQLYAQGWGLSGVPVGLELGTMSLFGTGRSLSSMAELGRGGDVGYGVKYADNLAFGRPLSLWLAASARPYNSYRQVSLSRRTFVSSPGFKWSTSLSEDRRFYTFRDPELRDISLDYKRRAWMVGGAGRVGEWHRGTGVGFAMGGETTEPLRTVAIRENGPIPVTAPALLQRYGAFSFTRVGLSFGRRAVRFITLRGLDAISAPQDIAIGWQFFTMVMHSVGDPTHADVVGIVSFNGAVGGEHSLLRWQWDAESRYPYASGEPNQSVGTGRIAWFGRPAQGRQFTVGVEAAGANHSRMPMQLSFRDDDQGLAGYRGADLGGAHRLQVRAEHREEVPSPTIRTELAVAGTLEAGRLWAGDAPYGVNTPWRGGASLALIIAAPAGTKQTIRIEAGVPLDRAYRQAFEVRISVGDRTRYFWGWPTPIWLARESNAAVQAASPP